MLIVAYQLLSRYCNVHFAIMITVDYHDNRLITTIAQLYIQKPGALLQVNLLSFNALQ